MRSIPTDRLVGLELTRNRKEKKLWVNQQALIEKICPWAVFDDGKKGGSDRRGEEKWLRKDEKNLKIANIWRYSAKLIKTKPRKFFK